MFLLANSRMRLTEPHCSNYGCQAIMPRLCWVQGRIGSRSVINVIFVLVKVFRLVVWVLRMVNVQNFAILLDNLSFMDPGQQLLQQR